MDRFIYPCIECTNDVLNRIPDSDLCECECCGHPQDIPTDHQLAEYNIPDTNREY